VPYTAVIRDRSIIAVWVSAVGGNVGFQLLYQYGPTYLSDVSLPSPLKVQVLSIDPRQTGFLTAFPHVLSMLIKTFAGPISDRATCVSEHTRVLMFTALSQVSLPFLLLHLSGSNGCLLSDSRLPASFSLGLRPYCLWSGGRLLGYQHRRSDEVCSNGECSFFEEKMMQVSRQYMHFVLTCLNILAYIMVLLLPFFTSLIAPNSTRAEVSSLFSLRSLSGLASFSLSP